MGFRKGSYATVWSVEEGRGNTLSVRLSTSRKIKDSDDYEQDFSGFCSFIGTAKAKASNLKPKDRIKLGDIDVTTYYNKDKGVEYITYKVFDFEKANEGGTATQQSPGVENNPFEGDSDEEKLPF